MPRSPIVFTSKLRVAFSDLDPFNHVGTAVYSRYFVDHRTNGLRDYVGWDLKTLAQLPFMTWAKRMEIDYLKSAVGDQELTLTSFVREFRGSDAYIECAMADEAGTAIARCLMVVACVDKRTKKPMDWPADAMALFFEAR
ncbi:MAG: hypothetical protein AMXMBFR36_21270 [Acidobacteriota bacterium]